MSIVVPSHCHCGALGNLAFLCITMVSEGLQVAGEAGLTSWVTYQCTLREGLGKGKLFNGMARNDITCP